MANLVSQEKRLFSFQSPVGDKLLCNSVEGSEYISDIFCFKLELASEDARIPWEKVLGKNVTLGIRTNDGKNFRYINGHLSKFAPARRDGRLAYYNAELVPWPWFLTLTQDCCIYQKKTVQEVITTTFNKFGFHDFRFDLKKDEWHQPWEYCTQYRETALDFVSRLLEIEGMYYYFEHEVGKHTMVIVDDKTSHVPLKNESSFRYEHNMGAGQVREEPTIYAAEMFKFVKPASYFHKEFNFLRPDDPLEFSSSNSAATTPIEMLEVYDYPGEYEEPKEGDGWSHVRQEAQEHDRIESKGRSNSRMLTPGFRFKLREHERAEQNIDYLLTEVTHTAHEGTLLPGTDTGTATYENRFLAIPSARQYRPRRETPLHRMDGAQTATVVGPKGEDIHTDEYGRVRVKFHWDRTATRDDNSCWIRVMQPWAGPGYGHVWTPRIGQEVVVDFLEGDPDRPIITGCVYNAKNRQPYQPLPDKKNWSGIKTRSTIGGTEKNYNELRFIDTKGEELYVMHAEKDMEITVNNDTNEVVDHNRSLQVKNDQFETVDRDKHSSVKRDKREHVAGDKHNKVDGEFRESIGKDMSLNVETDIHEKAGGRFMLEAGGDIHIKAGGRIILEAGSGILFLGQGGFIDITDKVVIEGSQVLINCGMGNPGGATSASPGEPGAADFWQKLFGVTSKAPAMAEEAVKQALASNPFVNKMLPETQMPSPEEVMGRGIVEAGKQAGSQIAGALTKTAQQLGIGKESEQQAQSTPPSQPGIPGQILKEAASQIGGAIKSIADAVEGAVAPKPKPTAAEQINQAYAGPDEPDALA